MSAPKAIAQMIIIGGRILGRAFKDAYKQANANSAAARAAAGNANAESNSKDEFTRKTGIALDESQKILNINEIKDMEKIRARYEHLFKQNDPKDGGSLYLQAKVVRAFERIQIEYVQNLSKESQTEQPIDSADSSTNTSTESNNKNSNTTNNESK
ncbi:Mitochondrial import inner membrane translocase subunit tim16 [Smittium culicis]|uniref:Mitochondrial import inner membrane translocase subunit TIM16 n=2 Tax=Smittium culicis TaxID=133412 RepID=A0A1R1X0B7_9FUNG|nr:Mitochondrial import inner membrane translocase subunit tim16 [Smittium culicis]OMJ08071.1 Mitochondrial import inner membrane translocase subunit tim16 [Smittium culicis]